jgi:hypothetical protein
VPPPFLGGGAHSLAREGLGESQFQRGDIHCGTLYLYILCGVKGTVAKVRMKDTVAKIRVKDTVR